jgi:hypothetical protein
MSCEQGQSWLLESRQKSQIPIPSLAGRQVENLH